MVSEKTIRVLQNAVFELLNAADPVDSGKPKLGTHGRTAVADAVKDLFLQPGSAGRFEDLKALIQSDYDRKTAFERLVEESGPARTQ